MNIVSLNMCSGLLVKLKIDVSPKNLKYLFIVLRGFTLIKVYFRVVDILFSFGLPLSGKGRYGCA